MANLSKECKKGKVLRLVVGKKYFTKLCYRQTDYTAKQTDGNADSHPRVKQFIKYVVCNTRYDWIIIIEPEVNTVL